MEEGQGADCRDLAVGRVQPQAGGDGREHGHVALLRVKNDRNSLVLEKTAQKINLVFNLE